MSKAVLGALLPLEPPPAPTPTPWLATAALVIVILLLTTLLLWWRHPKQRRQRQLHRLQHRLTQAGCDTRAIATELDRLLRAALDKQRLSAPPSPTGFSHPDWQLLLHTLAAARFDSDPPQAAVLISLLPIAERLLVFHHGSP